MSENVKSSQDASTGKPQHIQPEDITEHMTRSEMIADIMCMLADADTEILLTVMDIALKKNH